MRIGFKGYIATITGNAVEQSKIKLCSSFVGSNSWWALVELFLHSFDAHLLICCRQPWIPQNSCLSSPRGNTALMRIYIYQMRFSLLFTLHRSTHALSFCKDTFVFHNSLMKFWSAINLCVCSSLRHGCLKGSTTSVTHKMGADSEVSTLEYYGYCDISSQILGLIPNRVSDVSF